MTLDTQSKAYKSMRGLSLAAMLITFILIVVGATVRVYDAGMSCPDWPKCYGLWWPFPVPAGSEYSNFEVFLEWVHRLIAMIVGFIMLPLLYLAVKNRKSFPAFFKVTILSFILLFSQVKMGAVTVWFSNINWSVALHLGNAMLFLATLVVLRMLTSRPVNPQGIQVSRGFKGMLHGFTFVLFCTMIMGAMVSSSYAGGVCGGLFSCQGQWWPSVTTEQLHMLHRALALITILLALALHQKSKKEEETIRTSVSRLDKMVGGQLLLGLITLYSFEYYPEYYQLLSVTHLAWGTLLFVVAVTIIGKTYLGPKVQHSKYFPGH